MNLGGSRVKIIRKFYGKIVLKAIGHENFIFCESEENRETVQSLRFSSRPKIWKKKIICFFGFQSIDLVFEFKLFILETEMLRWTENFQLRYNWK